MDEDLEEFKKLNPGILMDRRNSVCDEGIVLDGKDPPIKTFPKTAELKKMLKESARGLFIFSELSDAVLNTIIDCMFSRNVIKGERIITQGYHCDLFYIVESGIFNEWIIQPNGKKIHIDTYGPGSCFGQIALMHGILRMSTVRAKSNGVLWQLQRGNFKQIVLRSSYKKRLAYDVILNTVPELAQLDQDDKLRVADSLEMKSFRDGDTILSRSYPSNGIYFSLPEGVVLTVYDKPGSENFVELKIGDMFGESCMMNVAPRNINTVCSSGSSVLAFLPKSCVETLLGDCLELILQHTQVKIKLQMSGAAPTLF
ncbi:cAMP-dependent protein kinase type II regulatory subunit-like [Cimex lectularius]|uniref:Cyclic nucleotide-binding domain-containing protein n=1 Tax=Cimex lectularius TaxID=79782 RepID=A0A8I6SAH2_CIMLE|nr:cAMP-dependent protein kinase type II regulatory subunit-like [Cimex lectularius]